MINLRQGEAVFGTRLVQVSEVHADPSFPIFVLGNHRISQPLRVFDLVDGLGLEEALDLFCNRFRLRDPGLTSFLLDRPVSGVNAQLMSYDGWVDA